MRPDPSPLRPIRVHRSRPVIAIVGATGAVGKELLRILEERRFPVVELRLLASPRSAGRRLDFAGEELREATRAFLDGRSFVPQKLPHPYAFNLFSHDTAIDPAMIVAAKPRRDPVARVRFRDVGVDGPRRHHSCQAVNACNTARGAVP